MKRAAKVAATAIALSLCAGSALASEREQVCVREDGGFQTYIMQATVLSGSELNAATSSFNYQPFSQYVVVFWAPGQASVLRLSFPILTFVAQNAVDQYGRQWMVSAGMYC